MSIKKDKMSMILIEAASILNESSEAFIVLYKRAGIEDCRSFKDEDEFNKWFTLAKKVNPDIEIIKKKFGSKEEFYKMCDEARDYNN